MLNLRNTTEHVLTPFLVKSSAHVRGASVTRVRGQGKGSRHEACGLSQEKAPHTLGRPGGVRTVSATPDSNGLWLF